MPGVRDCLRNTMQNRFQRGREIAGLSVSQAASLLGLLPSTLEYIESGTAINTYVLADMAEIYQTSEAWLLGEAPQISAENAALLRDEQLSSHDRDILTETIGMWSTPDRVSKDGV